MSHSESHEAEPNAATPPRGRGEKIRLAVLLTLLIAAIAALGYDFGVARQRAQDVYDAIGEYEKQGRRRDDVRAELGEADEVRESDNGTYDIYTFRGGLPFRSYRVIVLYNPVGLIEQSWINETPPGLPE